MRSTAVIFTTLTFLLLTACSTPISHYAQTTPDLKLETFFNGPLTAHALVQDRSGKVIRRFRVDMKGHWDGNQGTLEEDFYYDDGETQRRVWHLEKLADGGYRGYADDVKGTAAGKASGFAFNWTYTLAVPVGNKVWELYLDDWMYLLDQNRLINRTKMKKFGFTVAELTLWIERTH